MNAARTPDALVPKTESEHGLAATTSSVVCARPVTSSPKPANSPANIGNRYMVGTNDISIVLDQLPKANHDMLERSVQRSFFGAVRSARSRHEM